MLQVSKEKYYEAFMNKDAVLSTTGNYPYNSEWTLRGSRTVIAKAVSTDEGGEITTKYFIN